MPCCRTLSFAAAFCGLFAVALLAQPAQRSPQTLGSVVISVRDTLTDAPLSWISVNLSRSIEEARYEGKTAEDGVFRLENIPTGDYSVDLHSTDYLSTRLRVSIRPRTATEVPVQLERAAVISGIILAPSGTPRPGAQVELLRRTRSSPYPFWSPVQRSVTDNDGRYRLSPLDSGEYYVRVNPKETSVGRLNDVYYPGVSDPREALSLHVEKGQETHFTLTVPEVALGTISGHIRGLDPEVRDQVELVLQRLDEETGCVIARALLNFDPDGSFRVDSLKSGRYGLIAQRLNPETHESREVGVVEMDIGPGPKQNVTIQLQPLSTLNGRFVFWGRELPGVNEVSVSGYPVGPSASLRFGLDGGIPSEDGAFGIRGLLGPHRLVVSTGKRGWIAESILLEDGTDIIDAPYTFEAGKDYSNILVVLSDHTATITGRIRIEPRELGSFGVMVVIFPDDEALWESSRLIRHVTPNDDGSFLAEDIPPGIVYRVGLQPWSNRTDFKKLSRTAAHVFVDRANTYAVDISGR